MDSAILVVMFLPFLSFCVVIQGCYAQVSDAIFDGLPAEHEVIGLVTRGVLETYLEDSSFLAPLAADLLGLAVVRGFVCDWWGFLKKLLVKDSGQPPTSSRALQYTMARRNEREGAMKGFLRDEGVRSQASALPAGRVNRDLACVFLIIEEVIEKTLRRALHDANLVKVTYPTFPSELGVRLKRIVYHLAGWLLGSALTRVKRDRRLGAAFLPFVNRHRYGSAEEFRKAHPGEEYRGVEDVVEERNVKWEGKRLIFPSGPFFEFGLAVEVGYRASLENPVLLAMYPGDVASDILAKVSSAAPVKLAWARCAEMVPDGRRGGGDWQQPNTNSFRALFQFVMSKWHDCRMYEFTRESSSPRKESKRTEKAAAVRDDVPVRGPIGVTGGGFSGGKAGSAGKTKKDAPRYTEAQKARALYLARSIGPLDFRSLTAVQLRKHIEECGANPPPGMSKISLQSVLRSLAPGIGMDADSEDEDDTTSAWPEFEFGTGETPTDS